MGPELVADWLKAKRTIAFYSFLLLAYSIIPLITRWAEAAFIGHHPSIQINLNKYGYYIFIVKNSAKVAMETVLTDSPFVRLWKNRTTVR